MKSILLGVLCALFLGTVQAASVTLSVLSFGTANDHNNDGIYEELAATISAASTGNSTHRGLLEFDLSSIQGNILSAQLILYATNVGGVINPPDVEFHGYAGNGIVELSDALTNNLITTQTMPEFGSGLQRLVQVDVTSFVQTLPAYAGIMLRVPYETLDVFQDFNDNPPYLPSLQVNYSPVPIPPALYLFGSGLIGLVGVARRKNHITL